MVWKLNCGKCFGNENSVKSGNCECAAEGYSKWWERLLQTTRNQTRWLRGCGQTANYYYAESLLQVQAIFLIHTHCSVAWSVICHIRALCSNISTDFDVIWLAHLCCAVIPCVGWEWVHDLGVEPPAKHAIAFDLRKKLIYDSPAGSNSAFYLPTLVALDRILSLLPQVRGTVADFAVFLSVAIWTLIDWGIGIETPKLNVPEEFKPTRSDRFAPVVVVVVVVVSFVKCLSLYLLYNVFLGS